MAALSVLSNDMPPLLCKSEKTRGETLDKFDLLIIILHIGSYMYMVYIIMLYHIP